MKKGLSNRLYLMYIIALCPLVIYGLFKNGILLYKKDLINFIMMFKPILILLMSVSGAFIGGFLREYKRQGKISFKMINRTKTNVIEAILVACILPIKSSPIVVFGISFLVSLVLSKVKFNRIALMYLIIEGINVLFKLNVFENVYEASTVLNYDALDLFWGLGVGGINSTSILFILLGLVFLCFNKLYKKEIVFSAIISFLILGIVPFMVREEYLSICPFIFGFNILFILVFILPNLYSSSYTLKGQIVSGISVGILTYLLSFVTPFTACILAVLIVSILSGIIDRIFVIK